MAVQKRTAKTSTSNKLTPFEEETLKVIKLINKFKLAAEANVVSIIYKEPDLLRETNLTLDEFHNNCWRVFFEIANDLILLEKKNTIDIVTFNLYLEKHSKLAKQVDKYGGYDEIEDSMKYVQVENFHGYVSELRKFNVLVRLAHKGFPISEERLSQFNDMTSEEIYDEYNAYLNDAFVNVDQDVKSYDITYNIDELIEDLDKGQAVGLEYNNMPILTKETGGLYLGSITLVGGLSNVGKSTFARTAVLPSIIKNQEPIVVMLNEDGIKKWQRELLVFVVNNILNFDLQKFIVRDGKYSEEVKNKLKEAANWIKDKTENHIITVVPFKNYQTEKAIKVIKKFSSMGVKQFLLDTYKMDAGKVTDNSWLEMQQNMVAINDVIKPEANNLHIMITFQLAKGSIKQRYYTQDNIGVSKNIVDPASTCIMIRDLYEDEMPGGNRELAIYHFGGANGKSRLQTQLKKDKRYQILFIVKNREGAANQYQIVVEHDMSRNIMKEIGITNVPIDF